MHRFALYKSPLQRITDSLYKGTCELKASLRQIFCIVMIPMFAFVRVNWISKVRQIALIGNVKIFVLELVNL